MVNNARVLNQRNAARGQEKFKEGGKAFGSSSGSGIARPTCSLELLRNDIEA